MRSKFLFLVTMLFPFSGIGQENSKTDSLNYYKFHAEAQFDMVGDYATSVFWLDKAIRLDPKDEELYLLRAYAKGETNEWNGREADYSLVIMLDPGNVAAYAGRASTRFKLKKYTDAIDDYSWLIDVDPNYYGYFIERGLCRWALNDKEGACSDYRKAAQLGNSAAYVLVKDHCLE
jgi:tetratricopeptide (TPR) repeat protein